MTAVEQTTPMSTTSETLFLEAWECCANVNQEIDFKKAARLWQQAADAGHVQATYNLACLYMRGEGVPTDHNKGLALLHKAAQLNNNRAREALRDIEKVGQSQFKLALKDIDFAQRRRFIIVGLVVMIAIVAIVIISIPNKIGLGGI